MCAISSQGVARVSTANPPSRSLLNKSRIIFMWCHLVHHNTKGGKVYEEDDHWGMGVAGCRSDLYGHRRKCVRAIRNRIRNRIRFWI